jgi:MFS family permease
MIETLPAAAGPFGGISRTTIAALLLASAQAPLGSTLIAVALPSIGEGLGVDVVLATGLLVTGYLVVSVVCQGPGGKVSDLFGHAHMVRAGILLYAAGALAGLAAPGITMLVVSRCTMALGGSIVVPATLALLRLHVPQTRRGQVYGLFGATMGLSAALGPVIGGEIVTTFGWRAIFLASLPFLALAWVLLLIVPLPASSRDEGDARGKTAKSFDWTGVALLALALVLLVVAGKVGHFAGALSLVAALAAGAMFIRHEARASDPILDPALFREPTFAAGAGIMGLQNFAMYGLLFQLPQFFVQFRGSTPRDVGYMLFAMMIGMVAASPIGGRLADRVGSRRAGLFGAAVLLLGSLLLCRLESFASPHDALFPLLIFGVGLGLSSAPAQASCMSTIDPRRAGMAAGASSTARYLGGIVTILVLGFVLGSGTMASVGSHKAMMWLFAAAVSGSCLAALGLHGGSRPSGLARQSRRLSAR